MGGLAYMPNDKRLYKKIFDELSNLISAGEYTAGNKLPTERELSEHFHVSRPTIREAIIALDAIGRVAIKPGSGVYVLEQPANKKIQYNDISPFEVIEARVLLEGEAAALAAKMITEPEISSLKKAFQDIKNAKTIQQLNNADQEFHSIIANATHNPIIANQIHLLWEIQENIEHIKEAHQSVCQIQDLQRTHDHEQIMLAIIEHDPNTARSAMHKHFSRVLESMHSALEEQALNAAKAKGALMRKRFSLGTYATSD